MTEPIDMKRVTPAEQLVGEDELDTKLLRDMMDEAEQYLRSFRWCPPIAEKFFGCGVGGVVAVFLFKLAAPVGGHDQWLWVVVGDVPSAYMVTDNAPDPGSALNCYCELMGDWSHAVLNNLPIEEFFPVAAPATPANATSLARRIAFIRKNILLERERDG